MASLKVKNMWSFDPMDKVPRLFTQFKQQMTWLRLFEIFALQYIRTGVCVDKGWDG